MTIRAILFVASVALALPAAGQEAPDATAGEWTHGSALVGEIKYPPGFPHFDYVDPDAPKGGTVRLSALGSFDSFNPILPQGEAATGLGLVYETLMSRSLDEISAHYSLLAEAMRYPADFSSVTFRLDPDARWHDGEPVTVDDVIWSFETLTTLSPTYIDYYANVVSAEESAPGEVTFTFDQTGNRELPHIMGELLVLPQHWWEGTNAEGEPRDIASSTLELPMGSGPYRIGSFVAGRTVTFERVEDYWGADEPVNVGQNNFDDYIVEYFRDTTVMFEAFAADQFDWWTENVARRWSTAYTFPAVTRGDVVLEEFEEPYRSSGVMVGFSPNLRQERFQDPRVREALNYAFDFEELNRTLFYGLYERVDSYFYSSALASTGLPEGEELEILQGLDVEGVPESVFTERYTNPTGGSEEALRENLRQALALIAEAGYTLDGTQLVDAQGRQLSFEILLNGPTIEPIALHLQQNLAQIGVAVSIRTVDSPQYINRLRAFDFDVAYVSWAQSLSPGNELRNYFGSEAASEPASRNYPGIENPAVDALIEQIVFADDRETLLATVSALDRVLLANHYIVPSYVTTMARTARWDRFGRPQTLPQYAIGFPDIWWWDQDKADAIEQTGR